MKPNLDGIPQDKIADVHIWRAWLNRIPDRVNMASGFFYDTTTQAIAGANTITKITFNSTGFSDHVAIDVTTTSKVVCANAGSYFFELRGEFIKANANQDKIWMWCRLNGTDVVYSCSTTTISWNSSKQNVHYKIILDLSENDYVEFIWSGTDAALSAQADVAGTTPTRPANPSFRLAVLQIA